jgi:hypothetical protein
VGRIHVMHVPRPHTGDTQPATCPEEKPARAHRKGQAARCRQCGRGTSKATGRYASVMISFGFSYPNSFSPPVPAPITTETGRGDHELQVGGIRRSDREQSTFARQPGGCPRMVKLPGHQDQRTSATKERRGVRDRCDGGDARKTTTSPARRAGRSAISIDPRCRSSVRREGRTAPGEPRA